MNQTYTAYIILAIEYAVIALITITTVLILSIKNKSVKQFNKVKKFIDDLDNKTLVRIGDIKIKMETEILLDEKTADKFSKEIADKEKKILESVADALLKKEIYFLNDIEEALTDLSKPYFKLYRQIVTNKDKNTVNEEVDIAFQQIKEARKMIEQLSNEYSDFYSRELSDNAMEDKKKRIMDIFDQTEQNLRNKQ